MAGIGFTLKRLTDRDDLMGLAQAYGMSLILSSGPWLFTVLALAGITLIGQASTVWEEMLLFRAVVTYNFSFSLVFSGPIVIVATRFLSDQIYSKDVSLAPGILVCAMGCYALIAVVPALVFYGYLADMTPFERVGAISGLFLIGFVWIAMVFVSALKDYGYVAKVFGYGMALGGLGCVVLGSAFAAGGLIYGFNLGLACILFGLFARIFVEYPYPLRESLALLPEFRTYAVLAANGLVYNMGVWIDKWIFWFNEPNAEVAGGILKTLPFYDAAMFMAYLVTVPGMALFFVSVETEFFLRYQNYFSSFGRHESLKYIREYKQKIIDFVTYEMRNMAVFLGCLAVFLVVSASTWFDYLGVNFDQLGVYRLGTVGAVFHTLFVFVIVFLSYFDMRRLVLGLSCGFLVCNAAFTAISLDLGFPYYGIGYAIAAGLMFVVSLLALAFKLRWLTYNAFVVNNPSITSIR